MSISRVLLVDDDPDIRRIGRLSLERIGGWAVEAVSSGTECLERVGDFAPDLILIDVMMPGVDGPATLAALRRDPEFRLIPVVFMSAAVRTSQLPHYRAMGASGIVEKPFDPMTLPDRLRSLLHDA